MWLSKKLRQKRGGVAVMVGLSIVVLFGFAALVIDVGNALVARNQLHNIADAAALASTRELGRKYMAMTEAERSTYVLTSLDRTDIETQGINVAQLNYATGISYTLDPTDIEIGQWDPDTKTFTVTDNKPDAVRVTSRRDTTAADGPISMFFARILGITTMNVAADATAALGSPGEALLGEINIPVALDEDMFCSTSIDCKCGQPITFYPTSETSCAGWSTFKDKANASTLKDIITDMKDDADYATPALNYGDTVEVIGGTISAAMNVFEELYTANADSVTGEWADVKIMIVDDGTSGCDNLNNNTDVKFVGIATATITNVTPQPNMVVDAVLQCNEVADVPGGGVNGGTMASIPKLVQ